MNTIDIVKDTNYNNIYKVDSFDKEFQKMFGKSRKAYEDELEYLATSLGMLDEGLTSALDAKQFHSIIGHSPLYSIRHVSKTNPRVVFVFAQSDSVVVLLSCTLEKETSDYDAAVEQAESRMRLLEEE